MPFKIRLESRAENVYDFCIQQGTMISLNYRYTLLLLLIGGIQPRIFAQTATKSAVPTAGVGIKLYNDTILHYQRIGDVLSEAYFEKNTLQPGDILTEVAGKSTYKRSVDSVKVWLRGAEGTSVSVKIRRWGLEKAYTLPRKAYKTDAQSVWLGFHEPQMLTPSLCDLVGGLMQSIGNNYSVFTKNKIPEMSALANDMGETRYSHISSGAVARTYFFRPNTAKGNYTAMIEVTRTHSRQRADSLFASLKTTLMGCTVDSSQLIAMPEKSMSDGGREIRYHIAPTVAGADAGWKNVSVIMQLQAFTDFTEDYVGLPAYLVVLAIRKE